MTTLKVSTDLPFNRVPVELLIGSKLELSVWSLVATDNCLKVLAENSKSTGLVVLNLSGAEKITDVGLQLLSDCVSTLVSLNLDNSYRVTSRGLKTITSKCTKLQQLSLAGCLGIDGEGFGILGQNCRSLITLKLSGCRQIKPWAFLIMFGNCKQIQSLDISFCSQVTDEAIQVLAENAPGLKQLNLRDCILISDIGLSHLSQGCASLSELNVRRSDMSFRITDVSLLQIGQACKSLLAINFHGCEMISDTGISWLSAWSKELRHIDLSNCIKVTNLGIRHLGEGCKQLRSIVLVNLKRVSDTSLRYLANGCHYLEAFNGSGLSMLTDGADKSGLEGLPALGKSHCSASIRHLNFHGCQLLSTVAMKAIAKFPNIETLDLSGCEKLTLEGALCIGKACKSISVLSLSSCGKCISNSMVEDLVAPLELLTSVNLSFCPKVGDKCLRALSACKRLESLDLSGCVSVTDQSIFHLCNGDFSPGLRHLFLAHCFEVGDTSLVWIAQGLKVKAPGHCVTLETLSLKGTRVTSSAVECIRDNFPYSSMRNNDSYYGFWPLARTADRKEINDYHKRVLSAARIQALVRTRREKDTLKRAKEEYCTKRAAILIGALFRGRKARRYCKELKKKKKERLISSRMIQCAYRCHVATKRLKRKREIKWLTVTPLASKVIQKRWRGVLGRREVIRKRMERCQRHQLQVDASIALQSWIRMQQSKRLKLQLLCRALTRELHRFRAALRIQCAWRIFNAVKTVLLLKEEVVKHKELQKTAAYRIAAVYRTRLFRSALQHRIVVTRKRLESTLIIQQFYRNQLEIIMRNKLAMQLQAERRIRASVLIQSYVRQWITHLNYLALAQKRDKRRVLENKSATTLSTWGRVWIAKLRLTRRRAEFDEEIKQRVLLKIKASLIIAAWWRGKLGRDRAKTFRLARAQKWKALFCDERRLPYYYNQDTGEIRWEKPSCLLDLEPKPICCNCAELLAEIECDECDEFFCTPCFEFIHYGGKRQLHKYRTLYDYYGKRKDYSREEFKTKVQQD